MLCTVEINFAFASPWLLIFVPWGWGIAQLANEHGRALLPTAVSLRQARPWASSVCLLEERGLSWVSRVL